jgi:hypothetical protein
MKLDENDADLNVITDLDANEIYMRMSQQSVNRKGYFKKNWSDEETKLLKWAVFTYTRQKKISYQNLVSTLLKLIANVTITFLHTILFC